MGNAPSSPVPVSRVEHYRVRFDECGADATLRTSAYVRYMQDVASVHSSDAGYTRQWYEEHRIFWLVRLLDLRIEAPSGPGDVLAVSTEVTGFRRIWARRRSGFRDTAGKLLAQADVDWILTDARGRPTRVPEEIVSRCPPARYGYEPARLELPRPPADTVEFRRRAEPHELDPMGHVNNAAYVDQLEAVIATAASASRAPTRDLHASAATAPATAIPRRYRLEYLAPGRAESEFVWRVWPSGDAWAAELRSADGVVVVRALTTG